MASQSVDRGPVEKEKKLRLQCQETEEHALTIMSLGKPIDKLSLEELKVFLAWHQVPVEKGKTKKADKLFQWVRVVEEGRQPPLYNKWIDDDEARLQALMDEVVTIADTRYGRDLALKKREMLAVADKFTAEERAEFRRRLDECEVVEALASLPSAGETHNRSIVGESIELV